MRVLPPARDFHGGAVPIFLSICLLASTSPAFAPLLSQRERGGVQDAVEEDQPLVALALEDWPPYFLLDSDGKPVGFAVDVMEAVARQMERPLRFKVVPHYVDAIEARRRGEADVIPFMGIAEGRREVFDFTIPFDTFAISVFARADSVSLQAIDDLAGRRSGSATMQSPTWPAICRCPNRRRATPTAASPPDTL